MDPKASSSRVCNYHGVITNERYSTGSHMFRGCSRAAGSRHDGHRLPAIQIGNIGAHMEKDINVIIEVDPDEAELLIGLFETLIDDWYVACHDRQTRMEKVVAVAVSKKVT